MISEKNHYIKPKTYGLFGVTLGLIALCHLLAAWFYGDVRQQYGMLVVLGFSATQYVLSQFIARTANEILLHTANLICVATIALTMQKGIGNAPLYILFALSTVTFSARNIVAYSIMLLGAIVIITTNYMGPIGSVVPPSISMAISITLFGVYTALFIGAANRQKSKANKRLQKTELTLLERQKEIQRQRLELLTANAQLQHQSTLLDVQLERATQITKDLAIRRADEDELVKAMHHDLREPLRSMISFNQLVARRISKFAKDEEIDTFLEFARDAGVRMDRMLADLLTFSTTSTNDALTLLPLGHAVEMAKENLSALINATSAEVLISELPIVLGIETQLIQLFQNLIANAIKYAQPTVTPVIKITSHNTPEHKIIVEVSDNGLGIAEVEQKRIFNLFSRVENTKQTHAGSGVGLALCKRISLAHGASLSVRSNVDCGSTFIVVFPIPEVPNTPEVKPENIQGLTSATQKHK